ncbi:hypothetical protein GFL57_24220 [Rhizobium leguminosarum bv. viciae]|nr:hypothetical protein [Rhizobium leguminosarum bv. viciae]
MDVRSITIEMVRSYAQACADVHLCIERLRTIRYDLLVIPSRGASPFVDGARSYAHALRDEKYADFDPAAPRIKPIEELYVPFTADIADDFPIPSSVIRRYWSRVVAAMIRRDAHDPALQFHLFLRSLSGALAMGSTNIEGGGSGRFIFIDTVVSGRAVCEIADAFAEQGVTQCHYILLIDEAGRRLKAEYRQKIDALVAAGMATKILVDRIFTEDEGPAMSGIWTVTFPVLMLQAQYMIEGLEDAVGAGLYYHELAKRQDQSNSAITASNGILGTMLFAAVRGSDDSAARFLEKFQDHVSGSGLQAQNVTKRIADPPVRANLPTVSDTIVSGSHVLRAQMSESDAQKIVASFLDEQTLSPKPKL